LTGQLVGKAVPDIRVDLDICGDVLLLDDGLQLGRGAPAERVAAAVAGDDWARPIERRAEFAGQRRPVERRRGAEPLGDITSANWPPMQKPAIPTAPDA